VCFCFIWASLPEIKTLDWIGKSMAEK